MSMRITKYGHCCLLIESKGKKILTDPGSFTTAQNELTDIDLVLITHEHADHCHTDSMKVIIANNPQATIVSNRAVAQVLKEQGIACMILEGNVVAEVAGLPLAACDGVHEEIFEEIGQVQNTGYLIGNDLYLPGDSFHIPPFQVTTLALPVAGPWCRLPDAMRFAIAIKPQQAFPIHDAMLAQSGLGFMYHLVEQILAARSIVFTPLMAGNAVEYDT